MAIAGYPLHPLPVTFPIAFLAGALLTDCTASERIRSLSLVWYHFIGNALALILSAVSLCLRVSTEAPVMIGTELLLSILVGVILAITGWVGGEMVFRHWVGMTDEHTAVQIERKPQA